MDYSIDCSKDGVTQQNFRKECDINTIVERARKTGVAPGTVKKGIYADVSNMPDYRACLEIVEKADEAFSSLDSGTRARFGNDPGRMIAFLQASVGDEKLTAEAIELGLVDAPVKAPVVEPKEGV